MAIQPLLITPGEPAGIGPDVTLKIAQHAWPVPLVAIADPDLLKERAKQLNLPITLTENIDQTHLPSQLAIIPEQLTEHVKPGELNVKNATYVVKTLQIAASLCLAQKAQAIVTGPVQKEIINQAGIPFSGHTEFFAEIAKAKKTIMLFIVDQMRVALATTHLPLAKVPQAITPALLIDTIHLLHTSLQTMFNIPRPRLLICGLNPHAGEGGYLGREEIDVIAPTLQQLRAQGLNVTGPLPADTIFTSQHLSQADAILAIYHDQALPLIKHIGFDRAVNVTLGLPFIRTSVDHGTALSLAGTGKADASSMQSALQLALTLCR